ncbi:hypothetical protein [Citrobacter cronae]|uniref:hypothetical protein n=1 Tax=Citrobacter cronae TaxID=1748967 RepID=UPI0019024A51|nr:hypothetical protein [Citrobacter cronae]MBJ8414023.1 hypothetical protein [Citrobacter cronae]
MKQPENTIVVKVAAYSLYITRLRVCRDSLAGCCNDAERRGWRLRALEQLSKASSLYCQRANSADTSSGTALQLRLSIVTTGTSVAD